MVTASAAIAAAAEYLWIASDLIKQPPAMTMARTVPWWRAGYLNDNVAFYNTILVY
jgi:hypothetical protein